jgi:O-antigen ligase
MLLSASRVTFAAFFFTAGLFVILIRKFYMLFLLAILAIISIIFTPQLLGRYQELIKNHLFSFVTPVHAQTNIAPVDTRVADALAPAVVPEARSLNIRLKSEWPKALRAFQKNPILGTGFSSVGLAVDNDYLRLLAETGSLGFFAFLLIILRYFKSTMKYLLTPPQDIAHLFITATTLGFLGLMLNAVFIDVFEASKIAIVTWTLLGLSHKATQLR